MASFTGEFLISLASCMARMDSIACAKIDKIERIEKTVGGVTKEYLKFTFLDNDPSPIEVEIKQRLFPNKPTLVTVGGLPKDSNIYNYSVYDVLYKILYPYEPPIIEGLSLVFNGISYNEYKLINNVYYTEKGQELTTLHVESGVRKQTEDITEIVLYRDNTALKTWDDSSIANGYDIVENIDSGITTPIYEGNIEVKVRAYDNKQYVNKKRDIKFVNKIFYGTTINNITITTEEQLRSLDSVFKAPINKNINLTIPKNTLNIFIALPSDVNLSSVTYHSDMGDLPVKDTFELDSTVTLNHPNGHGTETYSVYKYLPVEAFSQSVRYTISLDWSE